MSNAISEPEPIWGVYSPSELVARTLYAEDAAALIALYGDGATIRYRGWIVWTEGDEDQPAAESYDHVAETVHRRSCV